MSIWVYADGWPIPPVVLLGCLVVDVLYFRGLRVLLEEEKNSGSRKFTEIDKYRMVSMGQLALARCVLRRRDCACPCR